MAQSTARETLTCFVLSYVATRQGNANMQELSDIVYSYFFDDDLTKANPYSGNLPTEFNFKRMQEFSLDRKTKFPKKEKALQQDKSYGVREYKKDYPQPRSFTSKDKKFTFNGEFPTKLDGEIKSAFSIAKKLQETNFIGNLSEYIFYDQSSDFMKDVKDKPLIKTREALKLPSSVGSDMLSSVDIIAVRKGKKNIIEKDFKDNITSKSCMDILNNLATGETGTNTFRTLTNKYFLTKDMVGISLKKVLPNRKATMKIIGSVAASKGFDLHLDPYTQLMAKLSTLKNRTELFNLLDKLVEIKKIQPTKPRAYFAVNYVLNYKDVKIGDENIKITLQIGRSGFNAAESGKSGFVGGLSYTVGLPILQKYPRYNQMVREIVDIRKRAFQFALDKPIPKDIQSKYNQSLAIVTKNELVLYSADDHKIIKDFCEEYDKATNNKKNSFQQYRVGVSKLCRNKRLTDPSGDLLKLNIKNMSTLGVPKTLQNDYVHSQGLWMYTRENEDLKKFFKKQITLTLYGLMSKKGGKVFYNKKKDFITEDAFVKEFKDNNNTQKLAKFLIAPFIQID